MSSHSVIHQPPWAAAPLFGLEKWWSGLSATIKGELTTPALVLFFSSVQSTLDTLPWPFGFTFRLLYRNHDVSSGSVKPTWNPYASTKAAEELLYFSLRLMTG